MEKIPTIFDRNWEGDRKVNDKLILTDFDFQNAIATEKLDGMNVRVTVRNHSLVRLEKRRNPSKLQKAQGIKDPWYVDAIASDKADSYLFEASQNTDFSEVPDGEWSAEALGPKIQGNPLNLAKHTLFIFTLETWKRKVVFENAPTNYAALKSWLPEQKSQFGNDCGIEGIVWHNLTDGTMCKIKVKDFNYKS